MPIVNGIDIDTEDETKRRPMAIDNDFFSDLARATIFMNDGALPPLRCSFESEREKEEARLAMRDRSVGRLPSLLLLCEGDALEPESVWTGRREMENASRRHRSRVPVL